MALRRVAPRKPQPGGAIAGFGLEAGINGLGLVDQLGVVAEDHVAQFGMPVEAHGPPDEGIELPHQKVREVERRDLVVMRRKPVDPFEEGVAMRAGDHLDAQLGAFGLQEAACAAIGIDHEDTGIVGRARGHGAFDLGRDVVGIKVQLGRQAVQIHVIPAIEAFQREDLVCKRAAGNEQDAPLAVRGQTVVGEGVRVWQECVAVVHGV